MVSFTLMPHFVIEYSRSLESAYDLKKVMDVAFDAGVRSGVMKSEDIKVRAMPYDHARLGDGKETFLHVNVFLLAGRTSEQKEHVSTLLCDRLADSFPAIGSISIDIRDMDPAAYRKKQPSPE